MGPLRFGALHSVQQGHHVDVEEGGVQRGVCGRQDPLEDEELAVLGRHGGRDVLHDEDALLVGPVVEDVAEVVAARSLDGLLREEVVFLPEHGCVEALDVVDYRREVLQDQLPRDSWKTLVEGFDVMALASANVYQEYRFRVSLPRAVEKDLIYRKCAEPVLTSLERTCHKGIEVAHHWWVVDKPLEHTIRSFMRILERTRGLIDMLEARRLQVFRNISQGTSGGLKPVCSSQLQMVPRSFHAHELVTTNEWRSSEHLRYGR